MKKLDYVDSLRGLAILSVIMVHTFLYGKLNPSGNIANILLSGSMGVQLFFLASAFTLYLSYKNRSTKEIFPVRNFFMRRFFRIAPMYYLGIGYYLFQNGFGARYWLGDETHITTSNIVSNFTFSHGFNPYWINSLVPGGWSIGVEMMFYVMLPFLFSKIKNINQAFIFFVGSLILHVFLYELFIKFPLIKYERLWQEYLFFYFPSQLPVFMLGIILYFIVIEKESVRNISGKWILLFSGLVLVHLASATKIILTNHVIFSIGFLILGYALSTFRFKFLVNPIINHIGKVSFSIYLVHFAIIYWLQRFNLLDYSQNSLLNYMTRFLVVVVLSVIVSTLLYNVIEIPFQNLGKYIIERWEKKSTHLALAVNKPPTDN
jgi:peptidoglycan/LPS O-acetylase OafA/YrhL